MPLQPRPFSGVQDVTWSAVPFAAFNKKPSTPAKQLPQLRLYNAIDDISWQSIARGAIPTGFTDYSSTFSPDPRDQLSTPIALYFRHRGPSEWDLSPASDKQPASPIILKKDQRHRLRQRFQPSCESPTPSEDTIVRLNRRDDTSSPPSRRSTLSPTPDGTRSTAIPSVRPRNPSPPGTPSLSSTSSLSWLSTPSTPSPPPRPDFRVPQTKTVPCAPQKKTVPCAPRKTEAYDPRIPQATPPRKTVVYAPRKIEVYVPQIPPVTPPRKTVVGVPQKKPEVYIPKMMTETSHRQKQTFVFTPPKQPGVCGPRRTIIHGSQETKASRPHETEIRLPQQKTKASRPHETEVRVAQQKTKASRPRDTDVCVPRKEPDVRVPQQKTKASRPHETDVRVSRKQPEVRVAQQKTKASRPHETNVRVSRKQPEVRVPQKKTEVPARPETKVLVSRKNAEAGLPQKKKKRSIPEPFNVAPYVADFLSYERVLTKDSLFHYARRLPKEWYPN